MELPNVLTTEEKAQLLRAYGHDLRNSANILSLNIENNFELSKPVSRRDVLHKSNIIDTLECISKLSDCSHINAEPTYIASVISFEIERLAELYPIEIVSKFSENKTFELFRPGIWTVVSNLIRNAKNHGYNKDSWKQTPGLSLTLEHLKGFPETATFIPDGARDYKNFIAFRVNDNGCGFSQSEDLSRKFTTCPPKGEHGFGLYFTGLVAKVLQSPIEIKSAPGDTTVSFYHPIYKDE